MTVPRGNVRISCNAGRIRSNVPLRPTFEDDEAWYCGTAIAVPYVKLHKDFAVTDCYRSYGSNSVSVFPTRTFVPVGNILFFVYKKETDA